MFQDKYKITPTCWEWSGSVGPKGYGRYSGSIAHRLAYEKHVGPIPKGVLVRHTCDNRLCVNPTHLLLGTPAQNSQDMKDRARQARGETHSQAKLAGATVRRIRRMLAYGFAQRFIALSVGVSQTTISDIKRGKSWGWFR